MRIHFPVVPFIISSKPLVHIPGTCCGICEGHGVCVGSASLLLAGGCGFAPLLPEEEPGLSRTKPTAGPSLQHCCSNRHEMLFLGDAFSFARRESSSPVIAVSAGATRDVTASRGASARGAPGFHFQLSFSYGSIQSSDGR